MYYIRKPHARPVVVSGCANCGVGGTYYEMSDYKALSSAFDNLERDLRNLEKSHKEDVNDIKEDILTLRQIIKIHETSTGESMHVDELLSQILDKLK